MVGVELGRDIRMLWQARPEDYLDVLYESEVVAALPAGPAAGLAALPWGVATAGEIVKALASGIFENTRLHGRGNSAGHHRAPGRGVPRGGRAG